MDLYMDTIRALLVMSCDVGRKGLGSSYRYIWHQVEKESNIVR